MTLSFPRPQRCASNAAPLDVLLVGAVLLSSCATRSGLKPLAVADSGLPRESPTVLVMTSSTACGGVVPRDITHTTVLDQAAITGQFPDAKVVQASVTSLKRELAAADKNRGLVYFYSGHGREVPKGHRTTTALCLGEDVAVDDIIGAISAEKFPWAVVVASACNSAFIDPSVSTIPLAAISASPLLVATPDSGPSYLVGALIEAYHQATAEETATNSSMPSADTNCDGYLSAREWLIRAQTTLSLRVSRIALGVDESDTGVPEPHLRRNSTSDIPIWPMPRHDSTCQALRAEVEKMLPDIGDEALRTALAAQLQPTTGLPSIGYDFYLAEDDQEDCAVSKSSKFCLAIPEGFKPFPKALRGHVAQTLARFMSFAEVYKVEEEAGWLHFTRLRDQRHIATLPVGEHWTTLSRNSLLATWADGDGIVRFTRKATGEGLPSEFRSAWASRSVSVCPSSEGQCFWLKK